MLQFADNRSFSSMEDRLQPCTFCGKDLVVLPNDRRGGACFDCLSLLGEETTPCSECGSPVQAGTSPGVCPRCGGSGWRT
jgi:hypothetical protein